MSSGFTKYGVQWNGTRLSVELECIRKGGILKKKDGSVTQIPLFDLYKEAMTLLWPEDDWHRWAEMFLREILANKITGVIGPQNCVYGGTRILNPITGESPTIKELCDKNIHPTVLTMAGPVVAGVPFLKGRDELFEVVLENGRSFVSTAGHLVLSGPSFCRVDSLRCGQPLLSYDEDHLQSTSDIYLSTPWQDALNFQKKAQDSTDRCFAYSHPCDGLLHSEEDICQGAFPSPICVQVQHHKRYEGDLDNRHGRNRLYQSFVHPANLGLFLQVLERSKFSLFHGGEGTLSDESYLFQPLKQSGSVMPLHKPSSEQVLDSCHKTRFFCHSHSNVSCASWDHQTEVLSIKMIGNGDYYDLSVPIAHHYFAEGAIHHNSGKTYMAAKYALTDYWAFPNETMIMVSSTDVRGLELRVWGSIKQLFNKGVDRWGDLPGNVLESLHTITTDELDDNNARVLKKGIICIPCLQSGRYTGLSKFVGVKQKRMRLLADESQLMGGSFLDAISNLAGNPDFKAVLMGNPIDPSDPLGMACEPEQGWTNLAEPTVTTVWKTKFLDGKCINFVGTDSPNFDPPVVEGKPRYPYMIGPRTVKEVEAFWGRDSQQFWSQVMGVMKTGLLARRVITRDLCRQHKALDKAYWEGLTRTKLGAVDAAYSGTGGDRCVWVVLEFGQSVDGQQIIRINPPEIIPVSVKLKDAPEDQIADYVKRKTELEVIPPTSVFYDSTGRGTLGSAFARVFGNATPVPVEFGGRPTERPVRFDLFIDDDGERRWKTCREHYVDFVSELWFSVRYAIESEQIRELPEDVMKEGCGREYGTSKNNKFFVESKHDKKARERMGRSPDLFDAVACGLEGARRLGFRIQKLGVSRTEEGSEGDWFLEEEQRYEDVISSKLLQHA